MSYLIPSHIPDRMGELMDRYVADALAYDEAGNEQMANRYYDRADGVREALTLFVDTEQSHARLLEAYVKQGFSEAQARLIMS